MIKKGYTFKSGYRVQFILKEGEYARNFRVYDSNDDLKVLKLIDFRKLNDSQICKNGEVVESEILQRISHDNIVKYVDSGIEIIESVKYYYLVTDFISGVTLKKHLTNIDMNKYQAKDYIKSILEGVSHLHTHEDPIIHNELDLTNILIDLSDDKRVPKIIDFGHALTLSDNYNALSIEHGNPFFTAPELTKNIFSVQSDIFSIGAILYTLLNEMPPWFISISAYKAGNSDVMATVNTQRKNKLTKPEMADNHLFAVVQKALALNPVDRFQNCNEFIHALENKDSEFLNLSLSQVQPSKAPKPTQKNSGGGFGDVAGLDDLKAMIHEDIIDVLNDPEGAKEYGISLPNGMLLWGPPGCGKTYFAEKLGEEVGYNFLSVKPSDLGSIYVHGGQGQIKELFDKARENAPTIIFFDELDALVPNRTGGMNQSISGEVNEFLTQMSNCSEDGLFVIGATNRPDMIDNAVKRAGRIDKKFYIPRPDYDVRISLFKIHLSKRPIDVGLDYDQLSANTDYYVASDIALICNESAKIAKRTRDKISTKIVLDVIDHIKPSVDKSELIRYEELNTTIQTQGDTSPSERRSIGFKR
jgi:transitional endoplasmic reticulum ATPase